MSEDTILPSTGHNTAPITKLADEMSHHASLWSRNAGQGEKHQRELMVCAYRLRGYADDPETELLIAGLLSKAPIPKTKRSGAFTQYLHFAFHKANVKPEKSQLSRWAGALHFAWSQEPRPAADELLRFIDEWKGVEECNKLAREAAKATAGGGRDGSAGTAPKPIPLTTCSLPDELDGKLVTVRKTAEGEWQVIPRSVLSAGTTAAPKEPVLTE